jgi:outer membrane protein assembly factor BamA
MTQLNNKKILISLLILISLPALYGSDQIIIREISISGLKRTKEGVVYKILEPIKIGNSYSDNTEETIIQELRETGIFNPEISVHTEIINNEAYISIEVHDRWTLLPIPFFSISDNSSWYAGMVAYENNLLGYYKTMALFFQYGSGGWTFVGSYNDPLLFNSDLQLTSGLALGLNEVEAVDIYGETIREYDADAIGAYMILEYPFADKLSLSGTLKYDKSSIREESTTDSFVSDMNTLEIKGTLNWVDIYYDIPYEKGLNISVSPSWDFGFDNTDNFPALEGNISFAFSPWYNHLIDFYMTGGVGDLPVQKQYNLGGTEGTRVLPMGQIYADEYFAGSIAYNIPFFSFKGGTLSSRVFY